MNPRDLEQVVLHHNSQLDSLLMPMEVRLKTNQQKTAFGLVQVQRNENDQEGQKELPIQTFLDSGENMNCLSFYNRDRMEQISKLKLVICVCAYNQKRSMLDKSLLGIHRSLKKFKNDAGISSNSILVIVVFDGIQKINKNKDDQEQHILPFFERVDVQNGLFHRKDQKQYNDKRFIQKHNKYCEAKQLINICKNKREYELSKVKQRVQEQYKVIRQKHINKEMRRKPKTEHQKELFEAEKERKMKEFDQKPSKRKYALDEAYQIVLNKCQKFIKTTDDTSLVYPMKYVPQITDLIEDTDGTPLTPQENQLNVLLVIKHKNAKKLSSHALFFLGFCNLIKPEITILMDVGLQPQGDSIFRMYQHMAMNPQIGGACGYMGLKVQRAGDQFGHDSKISNHVDPFSYFIQQYIFDIQKAQRFEYHMGHIIDKPFEAAFDFIHVLPGAFSCYRYQSVISGLTHYLAPALDPDADRSLEQENINLAQDRILSLGLKANNNSFAYMPDVYAVVDPMSSLVDFIAQRRRWINGSWYAFYDVVSKKDQINHCVTHIQLYYYLFIHFLSYIGIGIYFATIYLTVRSITKQQLSQQDSRIITSIVTFIYVLMIGSLSFLSLTEKSSDGRFQTVYYLVSTLLGIYGIMVLVLMIYNLILGLMDINRSIFMRGNDKGPPQIIPTIVLLSFMYGTVIMYGLQVLLSGFFVTGNGIKVISQVVLSVHHFLFYAPTYLHTLMIYAFCKIDDFSWGTKGLDSQSKGNAFKRQENKLKKYRHVFKFLFWNIFVGVILSLLVQNDYSKEVVITVIGIVFFINTVIKFFVSLGYLLSYSCSKKKITDPMRAKNKAECQLINQRVINRVNTHNVRQVIEANINLAQTMNNLPVIPMDRSGFYWE